LCLEFEIDGEVGELPLPADCFFPLGRSEKYDLVLADDRESRNHVTFHRVGNGDAYCAFGWIDMVRVSVALPGMPSTTGTSSPVTPVGT
jgi:hypothetical protein